jgi:predicted CoA-binding protein
MPITDDDTLRSILEYETIAVIGCSTTDGKAAHDIPAYLAEHGYEIIPVNPFADEILGTKAYDSLVDVPDDADIDIVEVFRPSEEAPEIVEQVIDRHETCGDVRAVWLQLNIRHDEAAASAEQAGLQFVQDRCMKVDHGRLLA